VDAVVVVDDGYHIWDACSLDQKHSTAVLRHLVVDLVDVMVVVQMVLFLHQINVDSPLFFALLVLPRASQVYPKFH